MGAVVLWSSTTCTLAYLTELWPTFKKISAVCVVTWTIVIFRFNGCGNSLAISYSRRDLADLTAIRLYQATYVMLGPPVLAGCSTRPKGTVVLRSSTRCTLA
jgi:hypothetical protein